MYREETLLNVMRSVTRNGRSILLTAVLALVLVYMFSIVGFMFFKDDFLVSVDRLDGTWWQFILSTARPDAFRTLGTKLQVHLRAGLTLPIQ